MSMFQKQQFSPLCQELFKHLGIDSGSVNSDATFIGRYKASVLADALEEYANTNYILYENVKLLVIDYIVDIDSHAVIIEPHFAFEKKFVNVNVFLESTITSMIKEAYALRGKEQPNYDLICILDANRGKLLATLRKTIEVDTITCSCMFRHPLSVALRSLELEMLY